MLNLVDMFTVSCLAFIKSHHKNNEIENGMIKYVYNNIT